MATAPGFLKGDVVTALPVLSNFRGSRYGTRKSTASEKDAWYKERYAEAPHDCAGESWVHSGTTSVLLVTGTRYTVVRGRCPANVGWNTVAGYCEVEAPDGTRFKANRRDLVRVSA